MEYANLESAAARPKEQRALETIANEIAILRNKTEDQLMALSGIADRIFGPMPQAADGAISSPPPFSEIDGIHTELQRFRDLQADVSSQIDRLRNL